MATLGLILIRSDSQRMTLTKEFVSMRFVKGVLPGQASRGIGEARPGSERS